MKVLLGPLVSNAAGSFAGMTIQRVPGGHVVRPKPLPIRRRTRFTNSRRSLMASLSHAWSLLTNDQRDTWNEEALMKAWVDRFGNPIPGKGYWLFIQCNLNLYAADGSSITDPATAAVPDAITGLSASGALHEEALNLSWTSGAIPANNYWLVSASPVLSNGIYNVRSRLRIIVALPPDTESGVSIASVYNTRFGSTHPSTGAVFISVTAVLAEAGYAGPPVAYRHNYSP